MEEKIKQEIERINKIKGEARGAVLKPEFEYILEHEGKEGLEKLESFLEEMGFPLKYEGVNSMEFYPLKTKAAIFVAISELFGYGKEEFRVMGREAARFPVLVRRLMMLMPADKLVKEGNRVWQRYFTAGETELVKFNRKEREEVLRLRGFDIHPLECEFLVGYFAVLLQLLVKEDVECEETKCTFRGDEYHEFVLSW
ncbi:MAG: hypothetical protein GF370_02010 [Candidatus Nealsonbacteria bacterium]|nr:hypothetical protein [Candidatus Nealsonbacteria bacterium]